MRRAGALAVASLLALLAGEAPAKVERDLYALIGDRYSSAIVRVNPDTLAARPGTRLRLGRLDGFAYDTHRRRLALVDGTQLRIVDLDDLKQLESLRIGAGAPVAVGWLDFATVVVLRNRGVTSVEVLAIDWALRKIVRRTRIEGRIDKSHVGERALVALLAPIQGLGPSRLLVVRPDGRTRVVPLDRIITGTRWTNLETHEGESRSPGLALDDRGSTAYVVQDGVVAAVPLAGEPQYRAVSGTFAKRISGSWRSALWLGDGLLAVTGSHSPDGREWKPFGLELIDTTNWSARRLAGNASSVGAWRDDVLATGSWTDGSGVWYGSGLALFGRDGRERFRLLDGRPLYVVAVTLTRAYVYAAGAEDAFVVEPHAGRVVAHVRGRLPLLLQLDDPW